MPTHDQGYCFMTAAIFLAIGIFHIVRFFLGWEIVYMGFSLPFLWSIAIAIVCIYLSMRGFRAVNDLFSA